MTNLFFITNQLTIFMVIEWSYRRYNQIFDQQSESGEVPRQRRLPALAVEFATVVAVAVAVANTVGVEILVLVFVLLLVLWFTATGLLVKDLVISPI